jgi:hypothetical protein
MTSVKTKLENALDALKKRRRKSTHRRWKNVLVSLMVH